MDVAPLILEGRTFVPLRFVAEALGAKVSWNNESATASVELGDKQIDITVGERAEGMEEGEVPFIRNNRTMVPLRYVSELLGFDVIWDQESQTIKITRQE